MWVKWSSHVFCENLYFFFERRKTSGRAADRRKVTSGIWAVTQSSAGERLGYMHDHTFLRAECCASSPLFSQHVTSHLRVSVALAAVRGCACGVTPPPRRRRPGLREGGGALPVYSYYYLSHAPGLGARRVGTCFCDASVTRGGEKCARRRAEASLEEALIHIYASAAQG